MPSPAQPAVEVLRDLGEVLKRLGLRWYLFGAQAAIYYGSSRLTADVDVTVDLGERAAGVLIEALKRGRFVERFPLTSAFLRASRVVPVTHAPTGMPVDLVLAGPGLEELVFSRIRHIRSGTARIPVVRPEDLITLKLLAGRPTDLSDVQALLIGQRGKLKIPLIRETLAALEAAMDVSDLLPRFEASLAASHGGRARRTVSRRRKR